MHLKLMNSKTVGGNKRHKEKEKKKRVLQKMLGQSNCFATYFSNVLESPVYSGRSFKSWGEAEICSALSFNA